MKFSTVRLLTVGAILMVFATSGEAGAEPGRSGWYIGGGIGANWTSLMDQEGWNRDNYCYPDSSSCDVPGPSENISGYRWMYDLDMDAGSAFEVSIGRMFNRWRLELSAAQRNNAIEQKFKSVTFLDGRVDTRPPGNRVESNSMSRIDDLTTRTLSLNAYYDFTNVFERITPYLGVGLGVAFVEISGVHFSTDYEDPADPSGSVRVRRHTGRRSFRYRFRRAFLCRCGLQPDGRDVIGCEADVFHDGRRRTHGRLLGSSDAYSGSRLHQQQHVQRSTSIVRDVHGEIPVR